MKVEDFDSKINEIRYDPGDRFGKLKEFMESLSFDAGCEECEKLAARLKERFEKFKNEEVGYIKANLDPLFSWLKVQVMRHVGLQHL